MVTRPRPHGKLVSHRSGLRVLFIDDEPIAELYPSADDCWHVVGQLATFHSAFPTLDAAVNWVLEQWELTRQ